MGLDASGLSSVDSITFLFTVSPNACARALVRVAVWLTRWTDLQVDDNDHVEDKPSSNPRCNVSAVRVKDGSECNCTQQRICQEINHGSGVPCVGCRVPKHCV